MYFDAIDKAMRRMDDINTDDDVKRDLVGLVNILIVYNITWCTVPVLVLCSTPSII